MSADPDDRELLQAWGGGDQAAGDALVRRHYAGVLRFFELRTRAAEDLTQRTFLACVEGRDRFRGESSFRAYLFGIARHQLLQYLADRRRMDRLAQFDAPGPAAGTGMSTIMARREEQHILLRAMVALPPDVQIVLGLYYWEGLMAKEIGAVIDAPTSTVTTRLARARDQLRERVRKITAPGRALQAIEGDLDGWVRSLANSQGIQTVAAPLPRVAPPSGDRD